MPGNFQVLLKALTKFKYIILEATLSNEFKFGHKKFFAHQSFLKFEQNHTWKFPEISYFLDLSQTRCARKIPKPVMETALITKETTYTLNLEKYFLYLFEVT
jgi:hypothetical protein